MRVKIGKLKKGYYTTDICCVTVKESGEKKVGTISIDYLNEKVEVDLKEKLKYSEKLEILKALFYKFSYSPIEEYRKDGTKGRIYYIEQFKFVDLYDKDEDYITIIEELLEYPSKVFKEYKDKERLISAISISNEVIENARKEGKKAVELPPALYLNREEIKIYKEILTKYLKDKKYEFVINDISSKYNNFLSDNGGFFYIRAFEYVEK